jgi:hypothetical protein
MKSPFKVSQPPAHNTNQKIPSPRPTPGSVINHSREHGAPLPDANKDVVDHPPIIQYPQPATGIDHLPYKNTK